MSTWSWYWVVWCVLWPGLGHATITAPEVMARAQHQLMVPSEVVRGEMTTYLGEQVNRRYTFVLARRWTPDTATEEVRIDFESPIPTADAESPQRAHNRYLLKRVGRTPPTQWLYLPALRRVRIAPYHPAQPLLQSDYWFYDLTAISNLSDYAYRFVDPNVQAPLIDGTPQEPIVPYQQVRLQMERWGETYLIATATYVAAGTERQAQFTGYQEIAPGRFRPQQLSIRSASGRTDIVFRHWSLNAVAPQLFTQSALETQTLEFAGQAPAP